MTMGTDTSSPFHCYEILTKVNNAKDKPAQDCSIKKHDSAFQDSSKTLLILKSKWFN